MWYQGSSKYSNNRNVLVMKFRLTWVFMSIYNTKETNIIASNSNEKRENDHWLNFENWPLEIYIRIIKHYTDIDPTVNARPRISCIYNRPWTN